MTQQKSLASLCKVLRQCWTVSTAASDGSRNQHTLWHLCHLLCSLGSSGIASGSLAPLATGSQELGKQARWAIFFLLLKRVAMTLNPRTWNKQVYTLHSNLFRDIFERLAITMIEFALLSQVDWCSSYLQLSTYAAMSC